MKKNVKTIMGGFLSVALLAGFISCSNGTSDETNQAAQGLNLSGASSASGTAIAENIYSGDLITFKADKGSASSSDVNLVIKYDRSAKGAKEQISLTDVELEVKYNGTAISMPSTIKFELDEYSSLRTDYKDGEKETNASLIKEYKIKLPLNKKIEIGDTVTVKLNKAKVSGEGAATVNLGNVLAALIDNSEASNWYKELCAKDDEYKPLISKKNGKGLNEVEKEPVKEPKKEPEKKPASGEEVVEKTPAEINATILSSTKFVDLSSYTKVDVIGGLEKGDNVWGSGTKTEDNGDGTYTVTHGTGWDSNGMASMPVRFGKGDLKGYSYIIAEFDLSTFTLREGDDEYPSVELKVEGAEGSGLAKTINGTTCHNNGTFTIPLASVNFFDDAEKFTLNLRGTGTLKLKKVEKAKEANN